MAETYPIRWGFCCASKIANDVSLAMDTVMANGHRKVAVAARNVKKAEEFSQEHKFEKFYGSYQQLADDSEVEIVYVSSLHPQHYELSKLFMEHGKHVLCEKPLTMKLEHTLDLIRIAKEKKVFFMEGFWSRFFPVYEAVKKHVDNGDIGEVHQIHAHLHANSPSERMTNVDLGGSAWFDMGVYTLNLADFIYDSYPIEIKSVSERLSETVDKEMLVCLKYEGAKCALLSTSLTCSRPNTAMICGTKGYINLTSPFFNSATEYEILKAGESTPTRYEHPLSDVRKDDYQYVNGDGFKYELEHIRKCLRELKVIESPIMTHKATERLARVNEEIMIKQL